MRTTISGTGVRLPETIVTNEQLMDVMDIDVDWVVSRTGVEERRIADPGTTTSDLAIGAGMAALADSGLTSSDVDALIVATMTPDYYAPGPAPLVQHGMQLPKATASYCIRQQCSGFIYGLEMADALIRSEKADTVLVIGAEVHAGVQPWITAWDRLQAEGLPPTPEEWDLATRNRAWSVLFGDGAGAFVLTSTPSTEVGILATRLFTDGEQFGLIHIPALGSASRPFITTDAITEESHIPVMQGPLLYRQAVRRMPEALEAVLADTGLTVADINLVVAHQANERILDGVRKRLGVDAEMVPQNLQRYGNTTAATLPILFHELKLEGRVITGDLVAFVAFGAGAHWGATLYRVP